MPYPKRMFYYIFKKVYNWQCVRSLPASYIFLPFWEKNPINGMLIGIGAILLGGFADNFLELAVEIGDRSISHHIAHFRNG